MKVACVFCGEEPENKNKEHIFPKWLLKMTNFDKGNKSVGSNWNTGEELVFNMLSYTFPSCKVCNDIFGKIESKVKPIFEKLLIDKDVTGEELELLLDWFDKIRISGWLGIKYMNKDIFTMNPKYYINSRVGLKDRVLTITNTYKDEKTLNWSGMNTPAFMLSPTAFTLRVNNLVFVNCSSDFIISKRLGFPYMNKERLNPMSEKTDFTMIKGTKKSYSNYFTTKLYNPTITIAQPIYKVINNSLPDYYENTFIQTNSYDYEKGLGKIFLSGKGKLKTIEREELINFSMPEAKKIYGHIEVVRPILELQIELIKKRKKDLSLLTPQQKEDEENGAKNIISYLKEQIKQFNY